ncbi:cytochrome c biogenesis protein DipZ [Piscinibacter sp. XHJ-5]|uniref:cytochrome c biogenesis protein DipZ n=1 Tax=Piscinibacter sp. XHJ-5 TaxID=3037797 RepID=UPI002452EA1C|nr:cytochrome c biogenesis protein DipZ [Piscinibacter sp. XHJ-5]
MLTLLIAYLGGVLTILSPCVLPVLPFVFAGTDRPFRSHGLPLLAGMGIAFCAAATLAAVGGSSAIAVHQTGRSAALILMALFGIALMLPAVAERLARPLVALGQRLSHGQRGGIAAPFVLGVSTGLLWAPCAGPILGLVLTAAALNGAGPGTTLLLAAYAAGACTSLAAALLLGGRVLPVLKRFLRAGEWARRGAGAAVLASVGALALGVDAQLLSRLPVDVTPGIEQSLLEKLGAGKPHPQAVQTYAPTAAEAGFRRVVATTQDRGPLSALSGATEWINSPPLMPQDLRGKVVLVNFWTYSCINCLRTLPYLNAWAEKYKDAGLVVVGVHTPEFAFEKLPANVRRATANLRVGYPVVLDNDFAIWRAFGNRAWPAFYFVDAQGRVRHQQFGEDQYAQSERVLQQLLTEVAREPLAPGVVSPTGEGVQAAPGPRPALSGETYLGHERGSGFVSRDRAVLGRVQAYRGAGSLRVDQWTLHGDWTIEPDRIVLARAQGRIAYRFHARDLHLVLGPEADGKPVRFRVLVDGKPPLNDHGSDVDAQGNGIVDAHRLYQLVRQPGGGKESLFEIEFLDAGAQAYAFTFG